MIIIVVVAPVLPWWVYCCCTFLHISSILGLYLDILEVKHMIHFLSETVSLNLILYISQMKRICNRLCQKECTYSVVFSCNCLCLYNHNFWHLVWKHEVTEKKSVLHSKYWLELLNCLVLYVNIQYKKLAVESADRLLSSYSWFCPNYVHLQWHVARTNDFLE